MMLTEDAIIDRLKACAVDALELKPEDVRDITRATPIMEGLQLDSLRQVILLARIEEDYGFEFDPEDLTRMGERATVGEFAELILRRASEATTTTTSTT